MMGNKAYTKEILVEKMMEAGYDFVTTCEELDRVFKEFKKSGSKKATYHLRNNSLSFTLENKTIQ